MKNKILIINDVIIIIISIFLSILGANFINKTDNDIEQPIISNEDYFLTAYPIGSIYITTNINENTPEKMKELHGGTWESYGDGHLLQSNSSVEAGTTGGSNEVVLQIENIPQHSHNIPSLSVSSITQNPGGKWCHGGISTYLGGFVLFNTENWAGSTDATLTISGQTTAPSITSNVGNGETFSVQNKYITVYMWKRIE